MADIESTFRTEANVSWIAYGWRRNDSFSRALIMKKCAGLDVETLRVFPIRSWTRKLVYAYLDDVGIPRPPTLGRKEQGGLDFHADAIRELREKYPQDYERFLTDFPFAEVPGERRKAQAARDTQPAK